MIGCCDGGSFAAAGDAIIGGGEATLILVVQHSDMSRLGLIPSARLSYMDIIWTYSDIMSPKCRNIEWNKSYPAHETISTMTHGL